MNTKIHTESAPAAVGPYSQAIQAGNTIYVSGQLPIVPETGAFVSDKIEDQCRQSILNIKSILEAAGFTLDDVVKTTCMLADIADFGKFNEMYNTFFENSKPARACFAVKDVPKGALCEIEAVAVRL